MANISLKNVTKSWYGVIGVSDFSLEIANQEFIVLLGPSGCGKTTTMRMIAGLEHPTSGEIYFYDRLINGLEPKDRDVAMVFQGYGLYPNLTVYENIRFPLKMRKIDKTLHDEKVRKASDRVELGGLLDRKPKELSGGQRQRVALARAIVREPKVFLMDEPLSNLDAKLRVSTRTEIKHLQNDLKVTTIYVTHDQIEAMTLADRVVVMKNGLVQQVGTPSEIYNRPSNKFVAGFIGSPAMNLIDGEVSNGVFTAPNLRIEYLPYTHEGEATLGFRPEDAIVSKSNDKPDEKYGVLASKIFSIELLGDSKLVTIKLGHTHISIKADKNFQAEINSDLFVFIPPGNFSLYEIETNGNRLVPTR